MTNRIAARQLRVLAACDAHPPLSREQALALIYRHTHKDYKGKVGGVGAILVLRDGGTCLVGMTSLTDAEIADKLPYALKKEAERKATRKPQDVPEPAATSA